MSLSIYEAPPSVQELSVDTEEDLLLLNRALNTVIAEQRLSNNTDERKLMLAEALRDQVGEDMLSIVRGEHTGERRYPIEDKGFVLDAIEKVRRQEQAERAAQAALQAQDRSVVYTAPRPSIHVRPGKNNRFVVNQRITSFYDKRLDKKPHGLFSRLTDIL